MITDFAGCIRVSAKCFSPAGHSSPDLSVDQPGGAGLVADLRRPGCSRRVEQQVDDQLAAQVRGHRPLCPRGAGTAVRAHGQTFFVAVYIALGWGLDHRLPGK